MKKVYDSLEQLLIYGNYPAVLMQRQREEKIRLLRELSNASLYKDILEFQQIKNSHLILKLLKLLALQLGKEVSLSELA